MQDLVIRIRARNGKDEITVKEIIKALCPDGVQGVEKWIVQPVEGNSLEIEALAVAAQEIIKKHIVEPLAEIPLKMVRDISDEWNSVKDRVEGMLQGRICSCPECGAPALTGRFNEGEKFLCPECRTTVYWHFIVNTKHPEGGRWVLTATKV
jgi:hypothetical protein